MNDFSSCPLLFSNPGEEDGNSGEVNSFGEDMIALVLEMVGSRLGGVPVGGFTGAIPNS